MVHESSIQRMARLTPLGTVLAGRSLRRFNRSDRLDELVFELPLAGGENPDGWLSLEVIAEILSEWLGPEDPLAGYAERLFSSGAVQRCRMEGLSVSRSDRGRPSCRRSIRAKSRGRLISHTFQLRVGQSRRSRAKYQRSRRQLSAVTHSPTDTART